MPSTRSRARLRRIAAPLALLALASCAPAEASAPDNPNELVVRVLDVGQGDATLIENGGSRVLIDGGPDVKRMGELLDSLLDIAASEARRGDRSGFSNVDLSQVARDLVDLYADSAVEMGLELRAEIAPEVTMQGDAMQLTRAISNLLDNAFKYAGSGARVVLAIEPGPRIVVRDNGPGVPAPERDRIFERFQRCHGERGGHGLGLALVRAIARRHDLDVHCRDAQPGAEFVIEREES